MPQPKKVDRPVSKHIHLPTSLVAKVELELYSELEGRVPQGAWQRFIVRLVQGYLEKKDEA